MFQQNPGMLFHYLPRIDVSILLPNLFFNRFFVKERTAVNSSLLERISLNKAAPDEAASRYKNGGDLLSHTVTHAVPSALEGLTTVFGMETGVTPPLSPPKIDVHGRPARASRGSYIYSTNKNRVSKQTTYKDH